MFNGRSLFFAALCGAMVMNVGAPSAGLQTMAQGAQGAQGPPRAQTTPQAQAAQAQTNAAPSGQFRFHLAEATIADVHQAIRSRQITCRGLIQFTSTARKPTTARATGWLRVMERRFHLSPECCACGRAGEIPDRDSRDLDASSRLRPVCGAADRVRQNGAHGVRSGRAAAVRHDHRRSQLRADQRARHA